MQLVEKLIYYSVLLATVFLGPKLLGIPNNITTMFYGGTCMIFGMAYSFYYMFKKIKESDKDE